VIRNQTFVVEGILQDREGAPVPGGLVQIELDDIAVGSAVTGPNGVFHTIPIYVPLGFPLGQKMLTVSYGGDPDNYTLPSTYSKLVTVKGLSSLFIEKQVAKGDQFEVTIRAVDDLGAPLVRNAIDVRVGEDEIHQLKTDAAGKATFTTNVNPSQNTVVVYNVESLGNENVIKQSLPPLEITVPGAPKHHFPWWAVILGVVLLVAAIVAFVLITRRRRRLVLVEELARKIELVEYALATGDPVRAAIFELYRSFLGVLEGAGMARPSSETPAEMARSLRANLPRNMEPAIDTITELFQLARYSPHELGEAERGQVQESLQAVRGLMQRPAAGPAPAPAGGAA